jgi:hypothetical protein
MPILMDDCPPIPNVASANFVRNSTKENRCNPNHESGTCLVATDTHPCLGTLT